MDIQCSFSKKNSYTFEKLRLYWCWGVSMEY